MIMPQNSPSSCCNFIGSDLLLIRLSAKVDVDLCVTFLNFQYNPKSNDLVNVITPQKLMYDVVAYRYFFTANFYVDLYATFLNFQCSSKSSCLVNVIHSQNLLTLCCSFTMMFFSIHIVQY